MTAFLSALGWCFFGIAAVLAAIFLLRALKRIDRVLTLVEQGVLKRLRPMLLRFSDKT